ncbi:oocyte zinc finger protein XlCOF6-like isoform X1 [Macrobrachium rosenbergii]|uniref:oocyte zinc finger protein XlCOF6-like isoform X1 n=1 Tax=Macrobrachium rosenbergii TaxID=79674 RepID=UPI0034D57FF6
MEAENPVLPLIKQENDSFEDEHDKITVDGSAFVDSAVEVKGEPEYIECEVDVKYTCEPIKSEEDHPSLDVESGQICIAEGSRHLGGTEVFSNRSNTPGEHITCGECHRTFSQMCDLEYHMRTHRAEKPFTCPLCQSSYSLSRALKRHMKTHTGEKPFTCLVCQKSFYASGDLKTHMRTHTGEKPYTCPICQRSFSRQSHRKTHMRTHTGEKPYTCSVCQRPFARQSNLTAHMRYHLIRQGNDNLEDEHTKITVDGSLFVDSSIEVKGEPEDIDCEVDVKYACEPIKSEEDHPSFDMKSEKMCIEEENRDLGGTEGKQITCSESQRTFSQICNLKSYMKTNRGGKRFRCSVCQRSFSESGDLKKHMRTHTGEKPYACPVCQRSFSRQSHLKPHMRTHTGEKPYTCSVCQRSFSRQSDLKPHMRTHTGEKPYTCSVCQKSFSRQSNLAIHMRSHLMKQKNDGSLEDENSKITVDGSLFVDSSIEVKEEPEDIDCGEDDVKYTCQSIESEEDHPSFDAESGKKKPFSCPVCERSFSHQSALKKHIRIHTGEKPFTCSVCQRSFSESSNLKTHMRTHTGEKPYTCSICQKSFYQHIHLKKHLRSHIG